MDLSGILSIAGQPGLFKMISQMKGGVIVESLLDGKRMPAYASHRIMALEDISIYTDAEDVPLAEVFDKMAEETGAKPWLNPAKASIKELQEALGTVLPNYDRERVYNSDLKKLFKWFNLLAEKGMVTKEEEQKDEKEAAEKKPKAEKKAPKKTASTSKEKKPAKKKAAKKEND